MMDPVYQAREPGAALWDSPPRDFWMPGDPAPAWDEAAWSVEAPPAPTWPAPAPAGYPDPGAGIMPLDPYAGYPAPYDPYAAYGDPGFPPLPAPRQMPIVSPYDTDMKRGMPMWHIPLLITFSLISLVAFAMGGYTFGRWGGGSATPMAYGVAPVAASTVATAAAADTSSTAETSSTADTTSTADTGSNGPAPSVEQATKDIAKAPIVAQASMVAYRSGGYFWVANEQGGSPKKLIPAASTNSLFTISPDGKWLAVADGDNGVFHVVNTGTGADTKAAGAADTVKPSWAPNSSFVVYCGTDADKRTVKQVKTDGSKPIVLAYGTAPRVAPDGKTIYFIQDPEGNGYGPIALVNAGTANGKTTVVVKGNAYEVAVVQKGIVYAAADANGDATRQSLWKANLDGSSPAVLVAVPKIDGANSFASIFVTRDGKMIAYDVSGAQGFARLGVIAFEGGTAKDVSAGKDSYNLGWLSDGSALTYTTGNVSADPNSATSDLHAVGADGSSDRVLVSGGGQ